jgi:dTDP-4-amino-4,6-dideoxygalactose transaminase
MGRPAIEGGEPTRRDNFLIFGAPDLKQEDIDEVVDTIKSGWLSTGPKVKIFEDKFAEYQGVKYAVGTNSCTSALHLSLMALDLPSGSEVITTPMTFCATINSIIHANLKPVIVDCNRNDFNISTDEIEKKITPKTKVILPVHFAGAPCDMVAINEIAKRYSLFVVSDAAHAIETRYNGDSVANHSDLTAYSFYATKNLCVGEGGMVLTSREVYADRIRQMALHGMSRNAHLRYSSSGFKHYSISQLGYKYNMTDMAAALGINQLDRIEKNWEKRRDVWNMYLMGLRDEPLYLPWFVTNHKHGYHLFTVLLDLDKLRVSRDYILNAMIAEGIGVGVHYKAIFEHPYYSRFSWTPEHYPNAQWVSDRTLSLPIASNLDDKDIHDVCNAMSKVLRYYTK